MVSALASERFVVLSPSGPFNTAGDYYASFLEQNLAFIADGQLFTDFPVNAYLLFLFLEVHARDLATKHGHDAEETAEQFYIKRVHDKGDRLRVDDTLNFIGIIDWQMARVVPASEALGPSLVTANMANIYDGVSSLTFHDQALVRFLKAKGATDLAGLMTIYEKLRRFFFGLDVDLSWDETLLLVRGIWAAFGVDKDTDWKVWEEGMLRERSYDTRLKQIIDRFGVGL